MPKKKIQHKGKSKYVTEENEELTFSRNLSENNEEEYTTVVDFESNKKYNKRLILNNWSKYEASLSDFECENEDTERPKTDDFSDLLKMASSDCSHFQLSSEKLWESEQNSIAGSKIFNLDLNILSKGLACVPFYERLALDLNELTVEEKEKFDREAENSWKEYDLERKKFGKKTEDWKFNYSENDSKTSAEAVTQSNSGGNITKNKVTDKDSEVTNRTQQTDKSTKEKMSKDSQCNDSKRERSKEKIFFSENDENLEDWLDSVLDD